MELVLKLDKKHLKIFTELADSMNVKHFVVSEEIEDKALLKAMEEGDQSVLSDDERIAFENWLKNES